LSFEDSSIDFAYLHSIFTNLPDAATLAWFADLARIIRPGGIVAITTHRYSAIDISIGSVLHDKKFGLDFSSASVLLIDLEGSRGYIHLPYGPENLKAANVGVDYGNSFFHAGHARR
jgi:hypothetical protein